MTALRSTALICAGLLCLFGPRAGQAERIPLTDYPVSEIFVERNGAGSEDTDRAAGERHHFDVYVARDDARRAQGLMWVKELPDTQGMLFLFPEPVRASFWMKNTLIPLDLLFIRADGVVTNIRANAKPRNLSPLVASERVVGVLEINGGLAETLDIQPGDIIVHPFFGR